MKKINAVIQKDLKDCGVSCMQWIFMYYDGYISIEKLREDTLTNMNGTSAYHIVETFKKWNFDSYGVLEHDIHSKKIKFPLIAHLVLENGLEHFVVVTNVYKNTIYLMDPSVGYKKMSLNNFNKIFTGHIIMMHPRNEIIKMDKGITINNLFFKILKVEKSMVIKIIIISFLWTLFSILSGYFLKVGSNVLTQDIKILKYIIIVFLIIIILKIIFLYIREYYENHLNNKIDLYLYPAFIKHLFNLPLKNLNSRTNGEIMTRLDELANIKSLFTDIFISTILDSTMMILSIIVLFFINKELTIILLVFMITYFLLGLMYSKIIYQKALSNINYQTDYNSVVLESIDMINSIKNLNVIDIFLEKIEYVLSKYLFNNYKFSNFFNLTNFSKDIILELCLFVINSYGFFKILNLEMSMIDLFTYNILISYFLDPVRNIIALLPKYNYIKASFSKIMEFINIEEEKISKNKEIIKGDILFRNISYSYNNYDYILNDLNLCIKENSHVLLDGPSGIGKSTICKLLYGECKQNKGEISIGGKNILDIDLYSIRENILYVSQKENLFFGTIKENILVGRKISEEKFETMCKICEIEEIVCKKEMRYNAIIDPSFSNLSGGEKQRIILARGLLKNSNILILDEALSEVDKNLEDRIIKNIRNYFKDKTIIYISHKNQNNNFENIINLGDNYELV